MYNISIVWFNITLHVVLRIFYRLDDQIDGVMAMKDSVKQVQGQSHHAHLTKRRTMLSRSRANPTMLTSLTGKEFKLKKLKCI